MDYKLFTKAIVRVPVKPQQPSFNPNELIELFQKKDYEEALFLASPVLYSEFEKFLLNRNSKEISEKLVISLCKYALRMHNRSTPFGLFAGCGVSSLGSVVKVKDQIPERDITLDSACVGSIIETLISQKEIREKLHFFANNTAYRTGNEIRFIYRQTDQREEEFEINSIKYTGLLNLIWKRAAHGCDFQDLVLVLNQKKIAPEEAREYLHALIDNQLLIPNLAIQATGDHAFNDLVKKLWSIDKPDSLLIRIREELLVVQNLLEAVRNRCATLIEVYDQIYDILSNLGFAVSKTKLLKTDTYFQFDATNIEKHVEALETMLLKAVRVLNKLQRKSRSSSLEKFKQQFYERYENQEISLAVALDPDIGIGYGPSAPINSSENPSVKIIDRFLRDKLLHALTNGSETIFIDLEEMSEMKDNIDDLPPTMYAHLTNCSTGTRQHLMSLKYIGGSSAVNLIGRFGQNKEILDLIKKLSKEEAQYYPDVILAEISHLPKNDMGNVLIRPNFREYELPYLSNSGIPKEQQIPLHDLYISVKNEKLVLKSGRLKKEVYPRLSNAHFFSNNDSLPVYRFLCDMQFNDQKYPLYFNWGSIGEKVSFLPRVQVDSIIISPAKWFISVDEIESFIANNALTYTNVSSWLKNKGFPELFNIVEDDNDLLIDLRNDLSVKILITFFKRKKDLNFTEYFFAQDGSPVKNNIKKSFANEMIVFLLLKREFHGRVEKNTIKEVFTKEKQRTFSLGTEWLSYKFYCGNKIADDALVRIFSKTAKRLKRLGLIDKWFFVRYFDSGYHIRLRFHLTFLSRIGEVIREVYDSISTYESQGKIWKIQTETYRRELERYSAHYIEDVETLFCVDSQAVLECIERLNSDQDRFYLALQFADDYLTAVGINKIDFAENHKQAFSKEFGLDEKESKYRFDLQYRAQKDLIERHLKNESTILGNNINRIRRRRFNKIADVFQKTGLVHYSKIRHILSSLIHMCINKIFREVDRGNDLQLYQMLFRYYRSQRYRSKH